MGREQTRQAGNRLGRQEKMMWAGKKLGRQEKMRQAGKRLGRLDGQREDLVGRAKMSWAGRKCDGKREAGDGEEEDEAGN